MKTINVLGYFYFTYLKLCPPFRVTPRSNSIFLQVIFPIIGAMILLWRLCLHNFVIIHKFSLIIKFLYMNND